jgi:hypothetical protein
VGVARSYNFSNFAFRLIVTENLRDIIAYEARVGMISANEIRGIIKANSYDYAIANQKLRYNKA